MARKRSAAPDAIANQPNDLGRVFGRLRTNVLKVVDAGDEATLNLLFAEGVGGHLAAAGMRLVDDRRHLFLRQLPGVDDLDPVDAGVD